MKKRLAFNIIHTPWAYRYVNRQDGRVFKYHVLYGRYGYHGPPEAWTLVHPPPVHPYTQFYDAITDANTQAYRNINDFQSHSRQRSEAA